MLYELLSVDRRSRIGVIDRGDSDTGGGDEPLEYLISALGQGPSLKRIFLVDSDRVVEDAG